MQGIFYLTKSGMCIVVLGLLDQMVLHHINNITQINVQSLDGDLYFPYRSGR